MLRTIIHKHESLLRFLNCYNNNNVPYTFEYVFGDAFMLNGINFIPMIYFFTLLFIFEYLLTD